MKKYQVQWGSRFWIPFIFIVFIFGYVSFLMRDFQKYYLTGLVPMLVPLYFWIRGRIKTNYFLEEETLYFRDGLRSRDIAVESIREIEKLKPMPVLRPKGALKIYFNRFDEVIFYPEDQPGLIQDMVAINPEIKLVSA